jgi:hypothetical protein
MQNATYSPEDNKLRIYSATRLDRETFDRLRAAGFVLASKQAEAAGVATLMVAPGWSTTREDLLLELCGEIDDEDYSPEERSADRAERFENYRDKRADEAGAAADVFASGPDSFGNQSRARAERQAARHDRHRTYATTQWGKAEYWQERTRGVIAHALHRSSAHVRRGRLLTIEKELRQLDESHESYAARFRLWSKVTTLEGSDSGIVETRDKYHIGIDPEATTPAARLAYKLANNGCHGYEYRHPRTGKAASLYDHLIDHLDPITAREAAALWLAGASDPDDQTTRTARTRRHLTARLEYEKAMLAEEGGLASEAEIIPGGFLGSHQILKVNKSPATGRVVSVQIAAPSRCSYDRKGNKYGPDNPAPLTLQNINVERFGADVYRAPTDAELAIFKEEQADKKAERKAKAPAAPPLINPTDEDAERLQAIWNEEGRRRHDKDRKGYGEPYKPTEVLRITQAKYSANSKVEHSRCETLSVSERLKGDRDGGRVCVFKVRVGPSTSQWYGARSVIILTDKPQKPLPWAEAERVRAEQPTPAAVLPTMRRLADLMAKWETRDNEECRNLLRDAAYVGFAWNSPGGSHLTEEGIEAMKAYEAQASEQPEAEPFALTAGATK